jgi:hypothetical protein
MQEFLIKEYQILDLLFETCNILRKSNEDDMILATDAYTRVLSHLVENKNIHHELLQYKIGTDHAFTMINSMFHSDKNPVYAQLKIDNNLAKIYFHIVSKST